MAEAFGSEGKLRKQLARSYRDLEVYKRCFRFQQDVFKLTLTFPPEEKYSRT